MWLRDTSIPLHRKVTERYGHRKEIQKDNSEVEPSLNKRFRLLWGVGNVAKVGSEYYQSFAVKTDGTFVGLGL